MFPGYLSDNTPTATPEHTLARVAAKPIHPHSV